MHIAAGWARANGRRLLALTVDHGLGPASADWTAFAERSARAAGADWQALVWSGPKPVSGLPAAARHARHRLIADAARASGARVVLFAHTADDVAEGELMRAAGSTLGRLRDWAPSPAWPEGRGLMLLRPMLHARRDAIRVWLAGRGLEWIDDPANDDPRFARSRARLSLRPSGSGGSHRDSAPDCIPAPLSPWQEGDAPDHGQGDVRSNLLPSGEGWFCVDRTIGSHGLAATLVCAGGGNRPPRGDRLASMRARLQSGEVFAATLCGARIEAATDQVIVTREVGEFARRRTLPLALLPDREAVWDGRWAITAGQAGYAVVAAAGRMAVLSPADRAVLKALPPATRGSRPVLIRNDGTAPVLACRRARARSLVEERLAVALDRMTHERDLGAAIHGGSLRNPLFSEDDITV